jgi:hypothetical protein
MTDARYCRNCKWVRETKEQPVYWTCVSPRNAIKHNIDPVTGGASESRVFMYCKTLRDLSAENTCSPEGQWYEPK